MALREKLAEELITPKGYKKERDALVANLSEEKKQKIAELEQSLEDGLITEKEFSKTLSQILV